MDTANQNLWRGTSPVERADERRERLIASCCGIVGREGGTALTVRAVCRAAGVGPRYFYEEFPDTDALLLATYEHAVGQLLGAVASSVAATRAVGPEAQSPDRDTWRQVFAAAVDHLEQHPDEGRVIFAEALNNDVLRTRAVVTLPAFLRAVHQVVASPDTREPRRSALTATLLSGALAAAFVEWLSGKAQFTRDELIEQCTNFAWRVLAN